jgi:hypothetical protein
MSVSPEFSSRPILALREKPVDDLAWIFFGFRFGIFRGILDGMINRVDVSPLHGYATGRKMAEPEKKRVKLSWDAMGRELEEYFKTAPSKPPAQDLQSFLENPLNWHPNSPCLQGTIDNENNTALIAAVKAGADK